MNNLTKDKKPIIPKSQSRTDITQMLELDRNRSGLFKRMKIKLLRQGDQGSQSNPEYD